MRAARLTLHASSLQQNVHADVRDDVMPFTHSDDVSFTCWPHDVFIVHILLMDSFSLTAAAHNRIQWRLRVVTLRVGAGHFM